MKVRKVVIIHGFFMKAPIMWPLQRRLEELGFTCLRKQINTHGEGKAPKRLPRLRQGLS